MPGPTDNTLPLLTLQRAITDLLSAHAWFTQIPVLNEDRIDVSYAVELAAGKLGSCVVVETPQVSHAESNLPSAHFGNIDVDLLCYEQPDINRKRDSGGLPVRAGSWACETAQILFALLQHWQPPGGYATVLFNRDPVIQQEFDPDYVLWVVRFRCAAGFSYEPQQSLLSGNNETLLSGLGLPLTASRPR